MQTNVVKQTVETPFTGAGLLLSVFQKSVSGTFEYALLRLFKISKGLLLSGRNHFGFQSHTFSAFQDMGSLRLEKLYLSDFTAAKSSNGSLRPFFCFNSLQVTI